MIIKLKCVFLILICSSSLLLAQEWDRNDLEICNSFEEFEHILHQENDTTYIVNFWATWCGPCVKELPYFEELNDVYKDDKVKVVLVSLDFEKMVDKMLLPFLNRKEIDSHVVLLLDGKPNKWIDKVDPSWSGSIPITIIYNKDERFFYEKSFHSTEELTALINPLLK